MIALAVVMDEVGFLTTAAASNESTEMALMRASMLYEKTGRMSGGKYLVG
jgi:hypothetical protein